MTFIMITFNRKIVLLDVVENILNDDEISSYCEF